MGIIDSIYAYLGIVKNSDLIKIYRESLVYYCGIDNNRYKGLCCVLLNKKNILIYNHLQNIYIKNYLYNLMIKDENLRKHHLRHLCNPILDGFWFPKDLEGLEYRKNLLIKALVKLQS